MLQSIFFGPNLPPYLTPPQQEGLINKTLIRDVFLKIFSYLREKDLNSIANVCRKWRDLSIPTIQKEECRKFTQFIELIPYQSCEEEKKQLVKELEEYKNLVFSSPKEAQLTAKRKILNSLPKFETCKMLFLDYEFQIFFCEVINLLIEYDYFDKALEIVEVCKTEIHTLKVGFYHFIKKGQLNKAKNFAKTWHLNIDNSYLEVVVKDFLKNGEVEKAEKVAKLMTYPKKRNRALKLICQKYAEDENFDKAENLAKLMTEGRTKRHTLANIRAKKPRFYKTAFEGVKKIFYS